jgi:hypothetical protein
MFTHEPSYSFARTMDPLLVEFGMHTRTPIHFAMREKNLPNLGHDESIFSFAPAGWALAPCIIATFRDSEYPAHGHNGKLLLLLFDKLLFHLDSREKMLTTFLRISRSWCTRSSSRYAPTIFFLQGRLVSTPWKCSWAVLSQFFTPLMDRGVGDAQLTGYVRNRLPARLGQPHCFFFELSRRDFLTLCHQCSLP